MSIGPNKKTLVIFILILYSTTLYSNEYRLDNRLHALNTFIQLDYTITNDLVRKLELQNSRKFIDSGLTNGQLQFNLSEIDDITAQINLLNQKKSALQHFNTAASITGDILDAYSILDSTYSLIAKDQSLLKDLEDIGTITSTLMLRVNSIKSLTGSAMLPASLFSEIVDRSADAARNNSRDIIDRMQQDQSSFNNHIRAISQKIISENIDKQEHEIRNLVSDAIKNLAKSYAKDYEIGGIFEMATINTQGTRYERFVSGFSNSTTGGDLYRIHDQNLSFFTQFELNGVDAHHAAGMFRRQYEQLSFLNSIKDLSTELENKLTEGNKILEESKNQVELAIEEKIRRTLKEKYISNSNQLIETENLNTYTLSALDNYISEIKTNTFENPNLPPDTESNYPPENNLTTIGAEGLIAYINNHSIMTSSVEGSKVGNFFSTSAVARLPDEYLGSDPINWVPTEVFLSYSGPSEYEYTEWGTWQAEGVSNTAWNHAEGFKHVVIGIDTPEVNLQGMTGSATYNGNLKGHFASGASVGQLTGSVTMNANFTNKTISGNFDLRRAHDNAVISAPTFSTSFNNEGRYSGDLNNLPGKTMGGVEGKFFGPQAQETGGSFYYQRDAAGTLESATGVFRARQNSLIGNPGEVGDAL